MRLYTLNYDRLFKEVLLEEGINCFEGFIPNHEEDYYESIPDIKKIISDFNSNVHYNLHGCSSWHITDENVNQLPGYQYYLTPFEQLDFNRTNPSVQIEKGSHVMLTNIISGFQKVQCTSVSPFRQMISSFDRDCIEADKMFIIGYSFGDQHINDIIINARKFNDKLEIIIVNRSDIADKFSTEFISNWGLPMQQIYKGLPDDLIYSEQFNVKIYKKTFADFLNYATTK